MRWRYYNGILLCVNSPYCHNCSERITYLGLLLLWKVRC